MANKKRKCFQGNISSTSRIDDVIPDYDITQYNWIWEVKDCPVYCPTALQFEDPLLYLHSIAEEASQYGICKIIPPLVASTPASTVLPKDTKFQTIIQPLRADMNNGGTITYSKGSKLSLGEFEAISNKASSSWYGISNGIAARNVEVEFWHELLNRQDKEVVSGVNTESTAFSTSSANPLATTKWNLKTLPKLPNSVLRHMDADAIQGVTKPMLDLGMLFGMFAWHVEENYLFSISYHCLGEPKIWYGVPGSKAELLEEVTEKHILNCQFPSARGKNAADILAKRSCMFPPNVLMDHGAPVFRASQMPGEFVITFPKAYHAGFSNGFNCCETINFATTDWFSFGALGCLNYAQIETSHIIPYEELVCKESMLLNNHSGRELSSVQRELAIAFTILVRTHNLIRRCLWRLKSKYISIVTKSGDSINCSQCHRNCYISYMTSKEFPSPTCMFHEFREVQDDFKIFVQRDILAIEAKAKVLEENKEVKEKVMDHICWMGKSDLFSWMLTAVLKGNCHHPFCGFNKDYSWLTQETKPSKSTLVLGNNCQIKKESSSRSGRVLSNNCQIKKESSSRSGRVLSNNCQIKNEISLRSGRIVRSNCHIKKENS